MSKVNMHLTLLPHKLFVIKLKREDIERHSFALMKLLIFPESISSNDRFFSVTEVDDEISLVLEEQYLNLFPKESTEVCDFPWRAIQVSEGADGGSVSTIYLLTGPLAKAGISVFYLSTSITDFALVPEAQLVEAVACLRDNFSMIAEGMEDITAQSIPSPKMNHVIKNHPLAVSPRKAYMFSIKRDMLPSLGTYILRAFFFEENCSEGFFSYTETEDEISIILSAQSTPWFPKDIISISGEPWNLIKVADGPLGFTEYGIVYSIADPLCTAKVSLFYISTFSTDYTLVQESSFSNAIETLKKTFTINCL